jgi:hypothetical protein
MGSGIAALPNAICNVVKVGFADGSSRHIVHGGVANR